MAHSSLEPQGFKTSNPLSCQVLPLGDSTLVLTPLWRIILPSGQNFPFQLPFGQENHRARGLVHTLYALPWLRLPVGVFSPLGSFASLWAGRSSLCEGLSPSPSGRSIGSFARVVRVSTAEAFSGLIAVRSRYTRFPWTRHFGGLSRSNASDAHFLWSNLSTRSLVGLQSLCDVSWQQLGRFLHSAFGRRRRLCRCSPCVGESSPL
jgi:hypothetical protein